MRKIEFENSQYLGKKLKLLLIIKLTLLLTGVCFLQTSATVNKPEKGAIESSGEFYAQQQQNSVSGKVTDSNSQPLPGVTVVVKGTTQGTVTNADGEYTLANITEDAVLVFSFVGYVTQEVTVAGEREINIGLKGDVTDLEEVIVVGYNTQRKVSLTGSISTVDSEQLKSIPTPTLVEKLQGKVTGLFVMNNRSQPGDYSGTSYNIRGYGQALIIIDGLEATNNEFLLLDPNEIDQLNILKDAAAAAVYGARAGNGVILVKTKRGTAGKTNITYSFNYGLQQMGSIPGHVNSVQLAQYENISAANTGKAPKWSMEDIDKFKAGNDPDYPSTDWWSLTLRDFAPRTQHNLNVNGGNDNVKYFISGGYQHQESLYRSNSLHNKNYNLRSNLDVKLSEKLNIGLDMSMLNNNIEGPTWTMEHGGSVNHTGYHWGIMMMLYRSRPQYPASFPDPSKSVGMGGDDPNPVDPTKIDKVGWTNTNRSTNDLKFNFSYKLPLNLTLKGVINYKNLNEKIKSKELLGPVYYMNEDANGNIEYVQYLTYNPYNRVLEDYTKSHALNQQYFLTWNGTYGDHKMDALFVYEHLSSEGTWTQAQRIRYEYDLDFLFAGPDLDKSNNGTGWQDGRIGQILSFNYDFRSKYLLTLNARRDGSPKFAEDSRWGIFPSVSAGWRISQENFMKSVSFISNLKLRMSAGLLGYDKTGNFQYLSTYSIRPASMMVDGIVRSAIRTNGLSNPNITWEKMATYNAGIDFGLINDKLSGAIDLFYRKRSDVLGTVQSALPDIVGATMPRDNIEEYSNRGIEFELMYRGKVSKLEFEVGGNISYAREKTEYVSEPVYANEEIRRRSTRIGRWSDLRWGYLTDGVFLSQEEIDNWAVMDGKNNGRMSIGDIRVIDYNKDGIITSDDRVVIGRGLSPDIIFGITTNFKYNNLSLNMLWQGAALYDISYGNADMAMPYAGGNAPLLEMYKYSFTPENDWGVPVNKERYPLYPRYYAEGTYAPWQTDFSTDYYLRNGGYLRLKTLELSYELPKRISKFAKMDNVKVYFSGINLLTFSELKFMDPEFQASNQGAWNAALGYPPTKTYSFGLVVNF